MSDFRGSDYYGAPQKEAVKEQAPDTGQPVGLPHDLLQAWHRIKDAMDFYAESHIARMSFDKATGAMSKTDVGYLASNCIPDVKQVDSFIHQSMRRCPITPQSLTLHQELFDMGRDHVRKPERESVIPSDRNEQFKKLCKLGTPINTLIGAARSAEGIDASHGVRKEWVDSLLAHAEEARVAWDGIVAMFEGEESKRGSE